MGNTTYALYHTFWTVWLNIKHCVFYLLLSLITIFWSLIPKRKKQGIYEADVYLLVSHTHFVRSLYAIGSLQYFFPGITIWVINDGTLNSIDAYLLGLFRFPFHIFSKREISALNIKAKKYTRLLHLVEFGWSGKKILYPLIHTKRKKIILLDTDVLFFRYPAEIVTWMESSKGHSLYLKDYVNFSIASKIELSQILPGKNILTHINTGLLCLDIDALQKVRALHHVDRMIPKLIHIVKSRMTYDHGPTADDFVYTPPLIEQTLYGLVLSMIDSQALSTKYMVYPSHKLWGVSIYNPIAIHFTGEIGLVNLPMYQYIFASFIVSLQMLFMKNKHSDYPWFLRSGRYCFIRSHHHVWHDARDHISQ